MHSSHRSGRNHRTQKCNNMSHHWDNMNSLHIHLVKEKGVVGVVVAEVLTVVAAEAVVNKEMGQRILLLDKRPLHL